jgi:hypothetical protein
MLPQEAIKRFDALYASGMRDAKRRFDLELGDIDNALIAQGQRATEQRLRLLLEATQKLLTAQAATAWRDLRSLADAAHDQVFEGYDAQLRTVLIESKIAPLFRQLEHLLAAQAERSGAETTVQKLSETWRELERSYAAEIDDYVAKQGAPPVRETRAEAPRVEGPPFVAQERLAELQKVSGGNWDLGRLTQLCVELNRAAAAGSNLSALLIVRAILDHVPPILGHRTFDEITTSYDKAGASFKQQMHRLQHLSRKVAAFHLNQPIRNQEILPSATDVDFRAPLGALLTELVRVLRAPAVAVADGSLRPTSP